MSKKLFWNRSIVTSSLMDDLSFKMRKIIGNHNSNPREKIFDTTITIENFSINEVFGSNQVCDFYGTIYANGCWEESKIKKVFDTNPDPLDFDAWQLLVSALAYNYLNLKSLEPCLALIVDTEGERAIIKLEIWVSTDLMKKMQ